MQYSDYFKEPNQESTLEEKIEIIRQNLMIALELKNKLNSIKQRRILFNKSTNDEVKVNSDVLQTYYEEDKDLVVRKLYNSISLLNIENLCEEEIISRMENVLKENKSNDAIISKIKLMLYKEYLLCNRMMFETLDKEELKEMKNLLKSLIIKINLLDEIEEDLAEEDIEELSKQNNNLFFLLSSNGNIVALESLRKNVPEEYYQSFKQLLFDLKFGNLKRRKRMRGKSYSEIKDYKIRITFDKLSEGNYLIIDAFVKKYDTSVYYRQILSLRNSQYLACRDYYLSRMSEEDFISEHELYFDEVVNMLDSKTKGGNSYERRLN